VFAHSSRCEHPVECQQCREIYALSVVERFALYLNTDK